ncbi:hypothetical protein LTR56_001862 [Elasticomyces elasticus]|nr:hypothetical protein LTR56_001862 [Elasticomyces elasticus]KAK3668787.1 hypothetical protein LTR22_000267 [Elasticomyces elasticus]KAK4909011.1 hypothetical protein LTR49_022165 [Elasticomyces elasticus]KAK5757946.1 hypothetical protein LTS12_011985 [Elasticomyces elasticus]
MANKRKHDGGDDGPSKFLRSDYNATIRVLACSGEWKEARERTVRLNESDATTFQFYLNHLYSPATSLYQVMIEVVSGSATSPITKAMDVLYQLCRLWSFGDYIQDYVFQNAVIDAIESAPPTALTAVTPGRTVEWVTDNTTSDPPLRKWLAHALAPHLKASAHTVTLLDQLTGKLPAEFLMDLLKARAASLPTNTKSVSPPGGKCRFHVHPEGIAKGA